MLPTFCGKDCGGNDCPLLAVVENGRVKRVRKGAKNPSRKKEAMENLARYIIRVSFSQERMIYLPEESRIIYRPKDNRQEKNFDALDWLVPPLAGVRYYGFYSNVSRGLY